MDKAASEKTEVEGGSAAPGEREALLAPLYRAKAAIEVAIEAAASSLREGGGLPPVDAAKVRHLQKARRRRDHHFSGGMFDDPAWDMLLDLYAAHLEGDRVSVSSLCIASAVPPTTALRWIARLTEEGLLSRIPDSADPRRVYIVLTRRALDGMDGFFADTDVQRALGT